MPTAAFPVWIPLGPWRLHPHAVFDVLAYALGFQLYLVLRRRAARAGQVVNPPARSLAGLWLLAGAIFGAAVGAKLLAWIEHPHTYFEAMKAGNVQAWLGGKTIVGGLLGGWLGVELAKKHVGVRRSTGDLFVFPLILGMILGRTGCFLTGLADMTHGMPSELPWAVDFGDGIQRHPTQVYEIGFLALLAAVLLYEMRSRGQIGDGVMFRLFLAGYLAWRFGVEFIKPSPKGYLGFSAIQWASLVGVITCAASLLRIRGRSVAPSNDRNAARGEAA